MSNFGVGTLGGWPLALAFALACAVPAAARGQSAPLGDLSKKEAERRKRAPTPTKVYTNADLPESAVKSSAPSAPVHTATPTPAGDAAGANEAVPAGSKAGGEEKDEAWWRAKMAQLRENVRRNEMFQEALQSRINSLSADVLTRDDPYQRAKLGEDRGKAVAEMARVGSDIAKARQEMTDLEEEARKAGVPPGWLR